MRYGQGLLNLQELTFSDTSRRFGSMEIANTRSMQRVAKRGGSLAGGADLDLCRALCCHYPGQRDHQSSADRRRLASVQRCNACRQRRLEDPAVDRLELSCSFRALS